MSNDKSVVELLCAAAELRGYKPVVTAGDEVTVTGPAGTTVIFVDDLLREAAAAPPHDWAALAADYLGTALAQLEVPLGPIDFDEAKKLVRTRLYGNQFRGDIRCVHRTLPCGLVQRAVLDSVHTMSAVTYEQLAGWPIDERDLFVLAEENTLRDGPADFVRADFPDGVPPWYLLSGGDYTSAHALWLCDYPVLGRSGAVFAVPTHLNLYAAPVEDLDVLEAIWVLARIAVQRYEDDPWPVSPHLYHWHNGRIELAVHLTHDNTTVRIQPTDDFQLVLNQLAQ
ncbi:hypothetical protein [Nocardia sp. GAS34]|uniref:hypothetical protein n=1 Tax=unclassified Nocardia TaxID=2637762 RepID=UPI003D252F66